MKRLVLTVVIPVCLALAVSSAHAGDKSFWNLGAKAGVNVNYQWGGDIPRLDDSYAGFAAGAFLRLRLLSFLMLQPEILYSQQGSSGLKIDYIQIPVLVKAGIPLGNFTPLVFAGPVGSFKVSDNASIFSQLNVKDALFSLAMGAGVDIDIGKTVLTLEGRWTFSPMNAVTRDLLVVSDSMKNGTGSFMVGFGF